MRFKTLSTGSQGNCYLLQVKSDYLLIECGLPFIKLLQALGNDFIKVKDCLVSHKHKDHSHSIKEVANSGIYVWTNRDAAGENSQVNILRTGELTDLSNKNFAVFAMEGVHDCDVLLFQIMHKPTGLSFVYITDTAEIPYYLDADYYFVECNYDEQTLNENAEHYNINVGTKNSRVVNTHLSFEKIKEYFTALNKPDIKGIVLLHLSGYNLNFEMLDTLQLELKCPIYIAKKGFVLDADQIVLCKGSL